MNKRRKADLFGCIGWSVIAVINALMFVYNLISGEESTLVLVLEPIIVILALAIAGKNLWDYKKHGEEEK